MRCGILLWMCFFICGTWLCARPAEQDDAKTLKKAGIGDDDAKLVEYFRRRVVSDTDREKIRKLIRGLGHPSFVERERNSAELIKCGLSAAGLLREATHDKDVEIARRAEACLKEIEKVPGADLSAAAARAIARKRPEGAAEVLLAFLPFADDETVGDEIRDALSALAPGGGKGDVVMLKALDDSRPIVRAAAGEALIRANIAEARKLLTDPDAEVRLRAVLAAVTRAKDKTTVAALISLLDDAPRSQAWRVEDVLVRLAGEQAPAVSLGKDDDARKRCRDAWNEWWTKAAGSTDLNKLDSTPRTLGYTLIVEGDQRTPSGRVYEINSAGEVLWHIDNLQQPLDALVIGKDRLLIAEGSNYQISLRDFRGNVLWTKQVIAPHSLQPLPDNRVLVAGRTSVLEWDAKQSEKFSYQRDGNRQDICAACKTKNNEYWLVTQTGQCVRIDSQKKELKSISLGTGNVRYGSLVGIDALRDGHVLIAYGNVVNEYDANGGKLSWSAKFDGQLSSVQRLANGNTLIAGLNDRRVIEVDRDKEIVWEYLPPEPGTPRRARRR
jgi:outer membrane protein assembly factor BamB